MIRVTSANFYFGNKQPERDARFLRAIRATVNGVQEGHGGNIASIRKAIGNTHSIRYGNTFEGMDVPVVFNKNLNVLSFKSRQISKRAEVKNIGMPRAASILRFKKDGETYCFINTHLNAAVQGPKGRPGSVKRVKRVYEYTQSIIALERVIKRAKKRGEHVILVGDLNFRNVPLGLRWRFSPNKLFKRCGMEFRSERLDYVSWTKGLKMTKYNLIPMSKTGADHPWIVAEFEPRKP